MYENAKGHILLVSVPTKPKSHSFGLQYSKIPVPKESS